MSDPKDKLEESLESRAVAVLLQTPDIPEYKLAETLGVSRYKAKKLLSSPAVMSQLQELADQSINAALNKFKLKMDELAELAFDALKTNLKDKRLDAVRVWGEFVGLKDKKETEVAPQGITVVFPGANPEKSVESVVISDQESS